MSSFTVQRAGDPATRKLTIAEVKRVALSYYDQGGDMIVEYWDDADIRHWITTTRGTMEALLQEIRLAGVAHADMESTSW